MRNKIYIYNLFFFLFLLWIIINSSYLLSQDKTSKRSFRQKADTTKVKIDSLKKDTIPRYTLIKNLDVLKNYQDTSETITVHDKEFSDYFTFNDLLTYSKGFSSLNFGNPGQPNPITFDGLDWRHVNIFIDGIPFENSFFETPDNLLLLPEDISKVEILPSGESFLFGKGGASKSINIVTTRFNLSQPYTNLRHIEAPYQTYLTDGIFSQNMSRNSNIMAGFNYQTSAGRYLNSDYTLFNARTRLRFNFSDNINLLISDYYYKYDRGLNGGVDVNMDNIMNIDYYDEKSSLVMDSLTRENMVRNDLNAIMGIKLLPDSTDITRVTLSFISDKNDFTRSGDASRPAEKYSASNITLGIKQNLKILFNDLFAEAGWSYLQNRMHPWDRVDSSINFINKRSISWVSIYDNLRFIDNFNINIFARYNYQNNSTRNIYYSPFYQYNFTNSSSSLSYGLNCDYTVDKFKFGFESSNYYREKNIFEYYMVAGGDFFKREKHFYSGISGEFSLPDINIKLNCYNRNIDNPVENFIYSSESFLNRTYSDFRTIDKLKIMGLDLSLKGKYGKIHVESKLNYLNYDFSDNTVSDYKNAFPNFQIECGIYFQDTIINKDINVKVGFNGKYFSKFSGMYFVPGDYSLGYMTVKTNPGTGIINFFGILNIYTASIYITVENLFDKNYFIVPYYPMNGRYFRLAVSWMFND